jgi:polyphosphate kinase
MALIEASESGKQVAAVVELKARFDEENNIIWARKMDARRRCTSSTGLLGVKTHSKIALVVRQEGGYDTSLRASEHGQLQPDRQPRSTQIWACSPAILDIGADCTRICSNI